MNPYFICALPRSRTAWLANFLSYGPSYCFHEPYNKYAPAELPQLFASFSRAYMGVSDSLNTLIVKELLELFPAAKLVLVRRPIAEVDRRLQEMGLPCREILEEMDAALNFIANHYQPFIVNFHAFDARGVWDFLMPEVPLNQERLKMLEIFNVTVPKDIIIQKGLELVKRCSLLPT